MKKSLVKNTFREILGTKARFFSIMAIIGLGVGFLSGVNSTSPSMLNMAENYFENTNLMDFRIVSPVGFDKTDIDSVENLDDVTDVMPSYFKDVTVNINGTGLPVRVMALPYEYEDNSQLNSLTLVDGRLPKNDTETVIDADGLKAYKIGDTIKIDEIVNNDNTLDTIKSLEYKVVGTVRSSLNISFERGTTNVGDGKLRGFIFINKECFKTEKYTELYVKTTCSQNYSPFDDNYSKSIDEITNVLETQGKNQIQLFVDNKQNELDKKISDYNENKTKTENDLETAENKLKKERASFNKEISNAEKSIQSAETEYKKSLSAYNDAKNKYEKEISNSEKELKKSKSQLLIAKSTYKENKTKFDKKMAEAKSKLNSAKSEYKENYNTYYKVTKPQAEKQIKSINENVSALELSVENINKAYKLGAYDVVVAALQQINDSIVKMGVSPITVPTADKLSNEKVFATTMAQVQGIISNLKETSDNASKELKNGETQLKSAKAKIDKSEQQYTKENKKGKEKLSKAKAEIKSAEKKLTQGEEKLITAKKQGKAKLSETLTKLDNAKVQIDSSKKELESNKKLGEEKLKKAEKKLVTSKAKAKEKLNKANSKLESAQKKINNYKNKEWYVYTRDDNPGYSSFYDNCQRVDNVASVFPIFFLLVAILVCVTTMSRLVDEKRTEIGTLKALGYSNIAIMMKYIIYSSISSVLGCIVGIFVGVPILPRIIYNAYKIMYHMPEIEIVPSYTAIIISIIVAVLCTIFVAVFTCYKTLKENSSSLMRPKSPKAGTRILLEKVGFIWKRLSFTGKVTARNIFRYKARFMMTVLGVAGCTALILAAFYLHDSIADIVDVQFSQLYNYDGVIVNKNQGSEKELKNLTSSIEKDSRISDYMLYSNKSLTAKYKRNVVDSSLYLFVPSSNEDINKMINLRNRTNGKKIVLDDNGVVITEKLTKLLNVNVGDSIKLNVNNIEKEVKISAITEHYVYNYVYMSPKLYSKTFGENIKYNMTMIKIPDLTDDKETEIGNDFLKNDNVTAISFNSQGITNFKNTVKSLDMVVLVMIVCAALLAFVVLYNLTNINIAERQREIATLKVLGFYNKETSAYIYRENIVLTILGIILGLVLGVFLGYFIVLTVEIDSVMFGRTISILSFIAAALLTGVFSFIVNFIMHFKMKKIDMIESLKSVE